MQYDVSTGPYNTKYLYMFKTRRSQNGNEIQIPMRDEDDVDDQKYRVQYSRAEGGPARARAGAPSVERCESG